MSKVIGDAPAVWNLLNGVVCLYKPAGQTAKHVRHSFLSKLCAELNSMEVRPPSTYVAIEGKTTEEMRVTVRPSFADSPLVVGPRYQTSDFRAVWATKLGFNSSGVFVVGINDGTKKVHSIHSSHPLRTYRLKGIMGFGTDNLFKTGKTISQSSYFHAKKPAMEKVLARIQATHQRLVYESTNIDPQSQEAYNLAVKGLVRPPDSKTPIIYGARVVDFDAPNFTIEMSCINEYEDYLLAQLHSLGTQLRTDVTCTAIQCVHHSFFTLDDALLMKHWTLQDVIANMARNNRLIRKQGYVTANLNRLVAKH